MAFAISIPSFALSSAVCPCDKTTRFYPSVFFPYCLSQACLGKLIAFSCKTGAKLATKRRLFCAPPPHRAPPGTSGRSLCAACPRPRSSSPTRSAPAKSAFCLNFPMSVPSLSWQNDRFYTETAQRRRRFSHLLKDGDHTLVQDPIELLQKTHTSPQRFFHFELSRAVPSVCW